MATTTVQTVDISQALASILEDIDGLRVYWYISDAVRPPAVVIAQPAIDYLDTQSGFCSATWSYPMTLVVSRSNDRDAQIALSRYVQLVTSALAEADPPDIAAIEPASARPINVNVSGQELPGYDITVQVRA
jgi:hypothetical protein